MSRCQRSSSQPTTAARRGARRGGSHRKFDQQHERNLGNVTELTLRDVSIDDFIFGVAAYDASGHESLVSAYVNPPRPVIEVKTK